MLKRMLSAGVLAMLVGLSLAGCLATARRILMGRADLTTPMGMRVYFRGADSGVSEEELSIEIDRAVAGCERLCDGGAASWVRSYPIEWRTNPFLCNGLQPSGFPTDAGRWVHGCVYNGAIFVGTRFVLADEIGHVCFGACYGRSGEEDFPDGGIMYDPDFSDFLNEVR